MSLINEALKKAQRLRHEGAASASAGADPQGPIVKRAQPKSARSMLLLVVGAVALVVVSIALTAFWFSGPTPRAAATKPAAATAPAPTTSASPAAPIVVVPPLTPPPTAKPATEKAPAATETTATKAPAATAGTVASSPEPVAKTAAGPTAPTASTPKPASSAPETNGTSPSSASAPASEPIAKTEPAPTAKPDERVHQYVEALRVTGIRSSGNESKVLMNDRVYRVNDIVDRSLGIRLTKVSPDNLTFTDSNGVTYVKYF